MDEEDFVEEESAKHKAANKIVAALIWTIGGLVCIVMILGAAAVAFKFVQVLWKWVS